MAEGDPFDTHPVRSTRNRKFPRVDRTKAPVVRAANGTALRRSIADPGPLPLTSVVVTPLDENAVPIEAEAKQIIADAPNPVAPVEKAVVPHPRHAESEPEIVVESEVPITADLSDMTMPEVLLWAGDDPVRGAYALKVELERAKPRKGVLSALGG